MSRIGRRPIDIPDKVQVIIEGEFIKVNGPKGELSRSLPIGICLSQGDKQILVTPKDANDKKQKALWGMARTLVSNMVTGVTSGFSKKLEFTGVGYKASVSGSTLKLSLGYSHGIDYQCPEGIQVQVQKNIIEIMGCNKELVGFTAAKVRSFRPPEPYKGKGVKYVGEKIIRKVGKAGSKK